MFFKKNVTMHWHEACYRMNGRDCPPLGGHYKCTTTRQGSGHFLTTKKQQKKPSSLPV